MPESV